MSGFLGGCLFVIVAGTGFTVLSLELLLRGRLRPSIGLVAVYVVMPFLAARWMFRALIAQLLGPAGRRGFLLSFAVACLGYFAFFRPGVTSVAGGEHWLWSQTWTAIFPFTAGLAAGMMAAGSDTNSRPPSEEQPG